MGSGRPSLACYPLAWSCWRGRSAVESRPAVLARMHRLVRCSPAFRCRRFMRAAAKPKEHSAANAVRHFMSALAWVFYGCCALAAGSVHASAVPTMMERFCSKGRASRRDGCFVVWCPSCRRFATNTAAATKVAKRASPRATADWPRRQDDRHPAANVEK